MIASNVNPSAVNIFKQMLNMLPGPGALNEESVIMVLLIPSDNIVYKVEKSTAVRWILSTDCLTKQLVPDTL